MARPLNDSPYLYGIHDPGGEHIMAQQGIPGWVLFTEAIGNDPGDQSGGDYSRWADQGFGIIVRLNNGYEPNGTIPFSNRYAQFAQRCAHFVRSSRGCHIWIIGNEMNFAVERPGVSFDRSVNPPRIVNTGEIILPAMYANCYRQCRSAIRGVAGHQNDQVIIGAVAPWNPQTTYDGNPNGDWVKYLQDILNLVGAANCDGISIHAYTHGADPKLIYTDAFMNPPFQNRQYNFRTYQDFMKAIPTTMRKLPVYLTETDQDEAWRNENIGWVQRAYGEIDWWNRQSGNQLIRAVILYRWPNVDKWGIDGKAGVIEDFRQAMTHRYEWESLLSKEPVVPVTPAPPTPTTPPAPTTPTTPTTPKVPEAPVVPDTSPIRFDVTGKTAKGQFAAFYRQYGLDITGYPLNEEYVHPDSGLKTQDWQRIAMEEHEGKIRLRLAAQDALELRQRITTLNEKIAALESTVERLKAGGGGPAEPEMTDITNQLSRDSAGFAARPLSDIQHIVINHTGVRPEVGADRVAQAQRARWPGIVGQYFITGDGQIQQTNPLDQVVTADQAWIYNGINIYVAGNFDETVPSDAQLDALARLVAWLMGRFNLPAGTVKGAGEFIVTRSPGLQWLQGQRWKDQLLARVAAVPSGGPQADSGELASLRSRVSTLEQQLTALQGSLAVAEDARAALEQQRATLEQQRAALLRERDALQVQLESLQTELDALRGGSGGSGVPQPEITDIAAQLTRKPDSLKPRPLDRIKYIVINHTAVGANVTVERIAAAHLSRWGSILYQYLITGEGKIVQTNNLTEVVDLAQPWIAEGINIAVAGNFSTEVPTPEQIQATAALTAWLMQEHGIPVENIKGASELIVTQSPGTQWLQGKKWKETLLAAVAEIQRTAGTDRGSPADAVLVAALRGQISLLQAALNRSQSKVAALQQERDELLARLNSQAPDVNELTQRVATLTQQVNTLNAQVQALNTDKSNLSKQVQTLTGEKTTLTSQVSTLTKDKATLTQQVQSLTTEKTALAQQVSAAGQEKQALNSRIVALEQQIRQLQSGGPAGPTRVQPPEINDVVDKLPKHATLKYDTRTRDKITHIAIHHSAAPANITPERIAAYHVGKDWPGMGYHFYVQPDGVINQTNRLETVSYQVYNNNAYSVGISIAGNFVNGAIPTQRQIEQVGHLVAWLMQELNIPLNNVMGHKEYPQNATSCPGSDWNTGQNWKQMLRERIAQVQAGLIIPPSGKTIGHYMLFWQNANGWAREDWGAATNYFARFRPTAGFSPEDASHAEYVTIVGGVAGVSYQTEQMLIAAGSKVERLAGADFEDTKRMLDELASTGRRFKTFNV